MITAGYASAHVARSPSVIPCQPSTESQLILVFLLAATLVAGALLGIGVSVIGNRESALLEMFFNCLQLFLIVGAG